MRGLGEKWLLIFLLVFGCLDHPLAHAENGRWYKGDLHSHSIHSDGDSPVADVIATAESLGFDFFALTDHDADMDGQPLHWDDPGYFSSTLTLLYGIEWTTGDGHANVWAPAPFDYQKLWEANSNLDAEAAIAEAHAQGALFSVNHPAAYFCCPWEYPFYETIDTLEVWNSMFRLPNLNPWATGQIWDAILLSGQMMPCVGGSDTHQLQGWQSSLFSLGNPTTWVFAQNTSPRAILGAIKRGRTSISYAPDASRLDFTADRDNDGIFETLVGENLPGTGKTVTFRIAVTNEESHAGNAADARELDPMTTESLRSGQRTPESVIQDLETSDKLTSRSCEIRIAGVIKNGNLFKAWIVTGNSPVATFTDTTRDLDFYRAVLYGRPDVDGPVEQLLNGRTLALTSPIYVAFFDRDAAGEMQMFFGNLHSHTRYSDGQGTPAEAFAWARDVAEYDFYAVTDHAEYLLPWQWRDTERQADAFNENGSFVAFRGFEWSHPLAGHIVVLNTDMYTGSVTSPTLRSFYRWLDDHDGLAQFNHPGREPFVFHNFYYREHVADNIFAVETGNKNDGNNGGTYLPYYPAALGNGWRVAPTSGQDNHSLISNSHRTVIIAPELSRAALLDAMKKRRLYSTDDPNIQVVFKRQGSWMGSEIQAAGSTVTFTIAVCDDEPIQKIELLDLTGSVVTAKIPDVSTVKIAWTPEITAEAGGYFVKVTSLNLFDGDDGQTVQVAVTAPIWIK